MVLSDWEKLGKTEKSEEIVKNCMQNSEKPGFYPTLGDFTHNADIIFLVFTQMCALNSPYSARLKGIPTFCCS
jgi:hypothetical protein